MPCKQHAGDQQSTQIEQKVIGPHVDPVPGNKAPVFATGNGVAGPFKGCRRQQEGSAKQRGQYCKTSPAWEQG